MTSIKIGKDTATLLGVISRGKSVTVEKLIVEALNRAFEDDVRAALEIMKRDEEEKQKSKPE